MACYHPIPARKDAPGNTGGVTLWPPLGQANLQLPCGKCLGCRGAKAAQWGARATHEASLWEHNVFVTLTYDDEHLTKDAHLNAAHLTNFIKRLRKAAGENRGQKIGTDSRSNIRYLACGEYGETTQRPHYHAVLFNCGFRDAFQVGGELFESPELKRLWPYGANRIGQATAASATYVGQYAMKKQGRGDFNPLTGEERPAPFLRMSLRPAIGLDWLRRYSQDLLHGFMVDAQGTKRPIPRYYRKKTDELNWQLSEQIEANQYIRRRDNPTDRGEPARLQAAEIIHQQQQQRNDARRKI